MPSSHISYCRLGSGGSFELLGKGREPPHSSGQWRRDATRPAFAALPVFNRVCSTCQTFLAWLATYVTPARGIQTRIAFAPRLPQTWWQHRPERDRLARQFFAAFQGPVDLATPRAGVQEIPWRGLPVITPPNRSPGAPPRPPGERPRSICAAMKRSKSWSACSRQ